MKKSILKKLLSALIVIAMLLSLPAYVVLAEAGDAETEDIYSAWAYWDIFMAENVYGLGNMGTYSNFRGYFPWVKFKPVLESMTLKFGIESEWDDDRYESRAPITRSEVISDLYTVIAIVLELEELSDAPEYFVENGLIRGRGNGDYQLDVPCTTEELIIFSNRVHEHLMYELGLDSKGFLWKITGENNTVYLLGSIHAADGSLYPLSREILAAFAGADFIGFEVVGVNEEDLAYYYEKSSILDGTTIEDLIDPELYEMYVTVCQFLEADRDFYDYLQPWAAWSEMQYILLAMSGEEDETTDDIFNNMMTMQALGIDNYFMYKAYYEYKELFQLENAMFQTDIFTSFSLELQEALLADVLSEFYAMIFDDYQYEDEESDEIEEEESIADAFNAMLTAWKTGDEEAMIVLSGKGEITDDPLIIEYTNKLLTERDIGMTEKIMVILDEVEYDCFIIVGVAHLVGEDSVVDLLIQAGYEVERIK